VGEGLVVVLMYGVGIAGVAMLALLLYLLAVRSRRSYVCPQCGERLSVEYLNAKRCNMCGAPLNGNLGD